MSQLIEDQIAQVVRLRDEEDLTFEQIGNKFGFSEKTARRRYAAAVLTEDDIEEDAEGFPLVDELDITVDSVFVPDDKGQIERFKPLVRVGNAMVTMDWHIPLHKPGNINTMINCAIKNGIKKLIIGGDYFHMEAFSNFLPFQPEASLQQERHDGNLIMKTLCQTFDEIDFIWGNHDFRLAKKLGFKKSFEECMRWMLSALTEEEFAKIRFSELDYMYYYPECEDDGNGVGRKYRICHPRNFSSVPLTVPRQLAVKYSCSVITAHSHHCAIGVATNGYDIVMEGGGFFDKGRTEYIQKTTNNHEWVPGFTMFKDGVPHLYSPVFGNELQYRRKEVIK